MFDKLDVNKNKQVDLTDIEALFKAYSREKFPTINVENTLEKILKAFAVDDIFLDRELSRLASENSGNLQLEAFANFFAAFPGLEQYYKMEDITALGEVFVIGQGEVDLQQFLERLVQCKRAKNMQRSQGFAGIQAASLLGVSADSSAFTPHRAFTGSTPDGTRAYE